MTVTDKIVALLHAEMPPGATPAAANSIAYEITYVAWETFIKQYRKGKTNV